ncbi:MAG: lipoprotein [Burkholderiaceae bacterium]|nr:lipoprotein [Burkholderiaceae bacterium]
MRPAIQHTPALARIVAGIALVASLTACGYKGPLYMPPPPEPDAALTVPPAPQQPLTESAN